MTRRALAAGVIVTVAVVAAAGGVVLLRGDDESPRVPLPRVMVAVGDSITAGVAAGGAPTSFPERSWSTGESLDDSHYERLVALGADVVRHNVAVPGARMEDAPPQVAAAIEAGADYVTFLLGANDACRGTPVPAFSRQASQALDALFRGLPHVRVLVVSIPDIGRLSELFEDDARALVMWRSLRMCPALLPAEDPVEAAAAVAAYNRVLEGVCSPHPGCRYDGGAVFDHRFDKDDVSVIDLFHPSFEGQRKLAEITWEHGFWSR